jgi:hypothetical protein
MSCRDLKHAREIFFHLANMRLGLSGKCDSDQARAEQEKTCNGHSEETVRGEFFTHGTPPIARNIGYRLGAIARSAQRGRLSRCTVKEIPAGSENLNLTDALEQQRPGHPDEGAPPGLRPACPRDTAFRTAPDQGAGDASGLPFSMTKVSISLLPDTEQASWGVWGDVSYESPALRVCSGFPSILSTKSPWMT